MVLGTVNNFFVYLSLLLSILVLSYMLCNSLDEKVIMKCSLAYILSLLCSFLFLSSGSPFGPPFPCAGQI